MQEKKTKTRMKNKMENTINFFFLLKKKKKFPQPCNNSTYNDSPFLTNVTQISSAIHPVP